MKTKVFELISSLSDGGAETLVKDYACLLNREKFDVSIVCIYKVDGTANAKIAKEKKLNLLSIYPNHKLLYRIHRRLFGKWYIPYRLGQLINKEKPEVIHIHLGQAKLLVRIKKKLSNIRLLYTCHSVPEVIWSDNHIEEKKATEELIRDRNMRIIALHEEMVASINKMFSISNTLIVRNGVDFSRFRNVKSAKSELREKHGIKKDAFIIGNIGRFIEAKNQSFLLPILYEIKLKKSEALLMLIGAGELETNLKEKAKSLGIEDSVIFLSHRTDIPELLKMMDVFVFPSIYEGLSVTLVEAQVSGLKCVVSDGINHETLLSPNTFVVPLAESEKIWADAIVNNNEKYRCVEYGDIDKFDMNNEIRYLEDIYMGIESK